VKCRDHAYAFRGICCTRAKSPSHFWGGGFGDWLDFSLLPDYDQVAKYFYFTVYSGETRTDGLKFEFFTPRPPQLRQ